MKRARFDTLERMPAMKAPDLTYRKRGIFTSFCPHTGAGEDAWREIARQTEGTGKVFTHHLKAVLSQLRAAGYSVKQAKRESGRLTAGDVDLLAELERGEA